MTSNSSIKNSSLLSFVISSSFCNQILSLLRQTVLTSLLIGLIWLPGLPLEPAFAMTNVNIASQMVDTATKGDRITALIACLPEELSHPSLKRALDEMSDDQLERAFNVKANPKLSQAEIELKSCMSRQGFTN